MSALGIGGCSSNPCLDDGFVWQQGGGNCPQGVSATEASTGADTTTTGSTTGTTVAPTTTTDPGTSEIGSSGDDTTGPGSSTVEVSSATSTTTTTDTTAATETGGSSTTGPLPACGDGELDPGEECDDGNDVDEDTCTNTCTNAACGDGIVGPGEGCDDANDVDDDACSNACAPTSCGDGKVQQGEECDDADDDDTDECLSTCTKATCGDMAVQQGVEECDDGNKDETDACTSACKLPTCDDGAVNGAETDTDCGGGKCPKCKVTQACEVSLDCDTSLCVENACYIAKSCREIKQKDPAAPSGVYPIDPDGAGLAPTVKVYCDQETDGGGWTMLFKLSSGVAGDPSVLWAGPAVNEGDETLLNTDKSTKHYVSSYIGAFWNKGGAVVEEARVHVYKAKTIAKFFKYDALGTNNLDWYAFARLKGSSYVDIAMPFNIYGIVGEVTAGRRFYINRVYNGCPGDLGWLNVDTAPDPCGWETNNNAPAVRIIYAPGDKLVNWTTEVNAKTIGVGDVFAVFVR